MCFACPGANLTNLFTPCSKFAYLSKSTEQCFNNKESRAVEIYVMNKVGEFVEDLVYALNSILLLFPRPGLFPNKVLRQSKS